MRYKVVAFYKFVCLEDFTYKEAAETVGTLNFPEQFTKVRVSTVPLQGVMLVLML